MLKKIIIITLLVLLIAQFACAKQGSMKLLAVSDNFTGSTVDITLGINPGEGRIFIDTIPLSRIDTQASTRFAKEIACDFLDLNCDNFDFVYTIKGESVIVGGPSAGAAISVLTAALLEDLKLDNTTSITGTINSGGLIGTVGGLKEKIKAASQIGIKTVLIPKGTNIILEASINTSNRSLVNTSIINLTEYGKTLNITVIEVLDLGTALYHFTGREHTLTTGNITVDDSYSDTMSFLAEALCERSTIMLRKVFFNISNSTSESYTAAVNLTDKALLAYKNNHFYSAASYCFGANTRLSQILAENNFTTINKSEIQRKIDVFNKNLDRTEINTLADLEAYMVVKERLVQAQDVLDSDVPYATERYYSALSWAEFFGTPGKQFILNKPVLRESCTDMLNQAAQRISYVQLLVPHSLDSTKREFELAKSDLDQGDYALCLFKASKAKAEANSVLSVIGSRSDELDTLIDNRVKIVKSSIINQIDNDVFPILGYSYYEYALDLKDQDKFSTLLYLEYALELSDLDRFFEEKSVAAFEKPKNYEGVTIFSLGVILGISIMLLFILFFGRRRN